MAFDISYVLNKCDHRIHDLVIWEGQTYEQRTFDAESLYNEAIAGEDEFGGTVLLLDSLGAGATFTKGPADTVIATFALPFIPASDPRLFIKLPNTYNRIEVNPVTSGQVIEQMLYSLEGVTYGDTGLSYAGGGTYVDTVNPMKVWEVDYVNQTLIIYNYVPDFTWILDITTTKEECPYCQGSQLKHDLVLNEVGKLQLVANTEKLSQHVLKSILTPRGKNRYFPDYGTAIPKLIGEKNNFLGFTIRGEIRDQLSRIKKLQTSVLQSNPNFYTPYEALHDILGVNLLPDPSEPRGINLKVLIMSLALDKIETKTVKL